MSATRRAALAYGLAASALPARAAETRDAAPSASDPAPWIAYEQRLRARLADAGGGRFDEAAASDVLYATNAVRRAAGAGVLAWRDDLAQAARAHAADLAQRDYVEHLSPEGFDPSHRCWLLARRLIGSPAENIAYRRASTPPTPADVMRGWRGSPPHWRNLLDPRHTHAGFGFVRYRESAWAVGLYTHPRAELARPLPFRPATFADVEAVLSGLPAGARVIFDRPQGATGAPRVMQLSMSRMVGPGRVELIGGPIFVAPRGARPLP